MAAGGQPTGRYECRRASQLVTAHELRHACASLLIASGASDIQVAHQMGHSKIETTKNIYGHLFAWDRAAILDAMNQVVSRLYAYDNEEPGEGEGNDAVA